MTSPKFTELSPGSNKFPGRNDFTVLIMYVVCWQNCMEMSSFQSVDWFKLTNEVLNVRENIILCEMSLCCHPISEKKDAHDMRLVL